MSKQLKEMVKAFNEKADFFDAKLQQCDEIHQRFLHRWPRDRLDELLTLESYVIGTGSHDTFCYWTEHKTRLLGSSRGPFSSSYKVYYSPKEQVFKWVHPFQSAIEAFEATKTDILTLLNAAEHEDIDSIKTSELFRHSHLFRGKLLHLYFPKKFICIFSEQDIDYFLDRLGVEFDPKEHVIDKQRKLLRFKDCASEFKSWPSRKFMQFLYDQFLPPSRSHSSGESKPSKTDEELRKQEGHFVLPKADSVAIEVVQLGEMAAPGSKKKGKRKPNYIAEAVRNTKLGNHGEDLIVRYEQRVLRDAHRDDLAEKVERVSLTDDSLGYDIRSFSTEGVEKLIEVKSTTGTPAANIPFYLTENERQKMVGMGDNYFIYRLMAANTRNPKLLILNTSQFAHQCRMKTKLWQVSFVTGEE